MAAALDCPLGSSSCSGHLLLTFVDPESVKSISDAALCGPAAALPVLDSVEILGLQAKPRRLSWGNGLDLAREWAETRFSWHTDTQSAVVDNLQIPLSCPHEVHLTWEVEGVGHSDS